MVLQILAAFMDQATKVHGLLHAWCTIKYSEFDLLWIKYCNAKERMSYQTLKASTSMI